jgi:hypothetical protein
MSEPAPDSPQRRRLARHFRWQALFDHTADPLFLLNRRRRLLFVNRAWEVLTSISAAEAADLVCRRPRPSSPGDAWEDVVQHALTPPAEALKGSPTRVRRLLPGRQTRQWWEIDFLPLRPEGDAAGFYLLGRIRVLSSETPPAQAVPLPERLANLRQRVVARCTLDLWARSEAPAVRRLAAQARVAADTMVPVFLVGEHGAGKKTLARAIHYQGPRSELAFAALDCRRLPPPLVAAALFADQSPPGTAYLEEPERLPREFQSHLAEWLADAQQRPSQPRLLAGSPMGLAEAVRCGQLLEELAYLLGTLVLEVPPLRERRTDLPSLVDDLLGRSNSEGTVRITGLAADAWEVVRAYPWPGNISELYRAIAHAQAQSQGDRIAAVDLPAPLRRTVRLDQTPGGPPSRALPLDQLLEQAERRLIELALRRAGGNLTKAARDLGIWRQRLARRIAALEIAAELEVEIDEEASGAEG